MELSTPAKRGGDTRTCPVGFSAHGGHATAGSVLLAAAPFRKRRRTRVEDRGRRRQIVTAVACYAAADHGGVCGWRRGEPGGLRTDGGHRCPHVDAGEGGTLLQHGAACGHLRSRSLCRNNHE